MSLWFFVFVFLFALAVGIYVLFPRFLLVGLREMVIGTGTRVVVPVLVALAIMLFSPLPPILGGFVYFLLRPKRENISGLAQIVRSGRVEKLGAHWYDLYRKTVSSGGTPPDFSWVLAKRHRITFMVVTTLARTRSPEVLRILYSVLQVVAAWAARAQEQATTAILAPGVLLVSSSLLWFALSSLGSVPVWQEIYQVVAVGIFCGVCELVNRVLSV